MVNVVFFNTKLQSTELRITAGAIKAKISLKRTTEVSKKTRESFLDKHGWYFDKDGVYSGLCFAFV